MQSFEEFKDYLEALSLKHQDVLAFYYGGADRIINRQNAKIKYPCIWLEEPEFGFEDSGGLQDVFTTNILALTKPINAKETTEDSAKFFCKTILTELLLRMNEELKEMGVMFESRKTQGQFKGLFGGDLDVGADMQITITFGIDYCINPNVWTDLK
jgi:hypothetical protein